MDSSVTGSVPSQSSVPVEEAPITVAEYRNFKHDVFATIRGLHAKHGPIAALRDGSQQIVLLFDPIYNQQVLSDPHTYHARFFAIRGPKKSAQRRLTCGLLAMNGEQHRRNRRIVKEPFGLRAIASYGDTVVRLVEELLEGWRIGSVIDVADEMRRYMLRVTSTLLFGFNEPERAYRLGDMLARWVNMNHTLGAGALVSDETFSAHYEELLQFAETLEREIMGVIASCRADSRPRHDVLSILVRAHDDEGGLTDEELVGQAAVLFAAAHMTTAHALSWTLFLLSQHPPEMQRLAVELAAGKEFGAVHQPTGSRGGEANSLLERVIKESMRILPASAYSQRVNMEAVTIGPLHLPRGTAIVFTPLVIHHLPHIYEKPRRFLPDRWLDIKPSPYEYLPFGAGPRLCIGGPLALAIMRITLPRVLRKYRLTIVPGAEIIAQVESTMLGAARGIPMEVHHSDGNFQANPVTGNIHELVQLDVSSS